jgi:hypothetical protein
MGRSRNRVRELIKYGALPAARVLHRGRVWWLTSERDVVRLAGHTADLEGRGRVIDQGGACGLKAGAAIVPLPFVLVSHTAFGPPLPPRPAGDWLSLAEAATRSAVTASSPACGHRRLGALALP